MNFFSKKYLCVSVFLFLSCTAFAQNKAVIRVATETSIEKDRITLGDIAEISGAGEETGDRLKKVSLGYAPNIGMMRELNKDRILLSIAAAGFTKSDFSFTAPPKIIVRRSAQTVGRNLFREAIEKAVLADFQNQNITAKIVQLDLPANLQVPTGEIEIRVNAANVSNYFAPFSLPLELRVNEKVVRRISVNIQIEATAEVLIVARDLSKGEKINAADLLRETRLLTKSLNNYLRDAEKLRGAVLVKNLSAGTELTADAVVNSYVIRIGDSIRIVGESGKMQIIVNGKANSSGRIGDRIAVKNLQSGTNLQAVVVDEGLVKVLF